ncbi:hypothetical protein QQ045_031044 [Rhodiola kirilowii]
MAIILHFVDSKRLIREHFFKLSLNGAAKGVPDVWQFFSTLVTIANFVDSSAKRHGMLKAYREAEILDLVAVGSLETGLGMNQASTLQWHGPLIGVHIFDPFQKKDIDIVNVVECITVTKGEPQAMRDNGWDDLITKLAAFSCEHHIIMPDMSSPYKKAARSNEINITNEHYFRVNRERHGRKLGSLAQVLRRSFRWMSKCGAKAATSSIELGLKEEARIGIANYNKGYGWISQGTKGSSNLIWGRISSRRPFVSDAAIGEISKPLCRIIHFILVNSLDAR